MNGIFLLLQSFKKHMKYAIIILLQVVFLYVFHAKNGSKTNYIGGEITMRKKLVIVIPAIIIAIAMIAILIHLSVGSSYPQNVLTPADIVLTEPENALTPADLVLSDSQKQETQLIFDKSTAGDNVAKYVFKDFEDGCIYSLNQKIFILTENSDAEQVPCYAVCSTDEACTPIATTYSGNYMICMLEDGSEWAVRMHKAEMNENLETSAFIPLDEIAEYKDNSFYVVVEG